MPKLCRPIQMTGNNGYISEQKREKIGIIYAKASGEWPNSWWTINSRELLVPLISSGGVFPLTRLYQITHGSGGWEKLQEWSDGGAKRQSEERTNGSGADGWRTIR